MPVSHALTWVKHCKKWKKKYEGRIHYLTTDCKNKRDKNAYDQSFREWERLKAYLDGVGPYPYNKQGRGRVLLPEADTVQPTEPDDLESDTLTSGDRIGQLEQRVTELTRLLTEQNSLLRQQHEQIPAHPVHAQPAAVQPTDPNRLNPQTLTPYARTVQQNAAPASPRIAPEQPVTSNPTLTRPHPSKRLTRPHRAGNSPFHRIGASPSSYGSTSPPSKAKAEPARSRREPSPTGNVASKTSANGYGRPTPTLRTSTTSRRNC